MNTPVLIVNPPNTYGFEPFAIRPTAFAIFNRMFPGQRWRFAGALLHIFTTETAARCDLIDLHSAAIQPHQRPPDQDSPDNPAMFDLLPNVFGALHHHAIARALMDHRGAAKALALSPTFEAGEDCV
jgi:hypothetical protein